MDVSKIVLELTVREAMILKQSLQGFNPPKDDEIMAVLLFNRISKKIDELASK